MKKDFLTFLPKLPISYYFSSLPSRAQKKGGGICRRQMLLFAEGFAVGALIHGRILLMGAHQDSIQGAVVFGIAVVSALLNGAFDALICVAIHNVLPPSFEFGFSMAFPMGKNRGKIFLFIAIIIPAWYDKENKLMFIAPAWCKTER